MGIGIRTAVAALALAAAACEDTCPTETPQVDDLADCTAGAGSLVQYPVRLCPTCDQVISSCDVQISGTTIFLDPKVESCDPSNSCPPACQANPSTCNFTAPSGPGTYTVSAYDPARNQTVDGTLVVVAAGGLESCEFVAAAP
jgi:hypothetical protein